MFSIVGVGVSDPLPSRRVLLARGSSGARVVCDSATPTSIVLLGVEVVSAARNKPTPVTES